MQYVRIKVRVNPKVRDGVGRESVDQPHARWLPRRDCLESSLVDFWRAVYSLDGAKVREDGGEC